MRSLLQTPEWAALRQAQGWQAFWVDNILIMKKKLPLGLSFLYSPEVDILKLDLPKNLPKIKEIAQKNHSIFIRLDFLNKNQSIYSQKFTKILKDRCFIKAFEEIQPEYRQIIDIDKPEEQILAQMKPKGRYNIKVAYKHGVTVNRAELSDEASLDDFYRLFQETAKRDGFEIRPKKYFTDLLKTLGEKAELLVARYKGKTVAAGIFTYYEETASYLYGASGNEHREVMAPYLLHWKAIQEAKKRGCKVYDLLAIEPFDLAYGSLLTANSSKKAVSRKPLAVSHKFSGITRFKEQFGGRKIRLLGSWDLVLKPIWYNMFKIAEKYRRKG